MITEKKKLHIRNFLLIILMLCFIPFCNRTVNKETSDSALTFESENIRAVVAMSNDMYGKKGHKAGLNYEMLLNFTKEHDCTADIKAAKKGENWIDSLKLGVTDLVIMEYNDTTDYTGIKISNVVDNIVWAVSMEKAGAQKDINVWLGTFTSSKEYSDLKSRFYRIYDPAKRVARGDVSKRLSPYDDLIKKYAKETNKKGENSFLNNFNLWIKESTRDSEYYEFYEETKIPVILISILGALGLVLMILQGIFEVMVGTILVEAIILIIALIYFLVVKKRTKKGVKGCFLAKTSIKE
jgi:hypothetical protein